MIPGLGYSPSQTTPLPESPRQQNWRLGIKSLGYNGIFESWIRKSYLPSTVGDGHLGEGFLRNLFVSDVAAGDFSRWIDTAGREQRRQQEPDAAAWQPLSDEEWQAQQSAELQQRWREEEEAERRLVADEWAELDDEHTPARLVEHLPEEWRPFLERMSRARRKEREEAILREVGWQGVGLIGLTAEKLAVLAGTKAAQYTTEFPGRDEAGNLINQEPAHKRRRTDKWWRRRLGRDQKDAILDVEAMIGAVGGPAVPGRPLYAADYSCALHQDHKLRTAEILGKSYLIREDDPSVKISMTEVDRKSRRAKAAETRTLMDMLLHRWKTLGWYVCWITVTLPGRYVCHSTNEEKRVEEFDTRLGPKKALTALQDDHHRVMALLRERGIRPNGFWNSQPQQSGAPHRHYVLAVPTLEDARRLCDTFRERFSTRKDSEDDGPDRGCRAYVISDDDNRYSPPKGRNGSKETADSVARYAARYASRCEEKGDNEAGIDAAPECAEKTSEQDRFAAWKWLRGARTMGWLGFDSQRSPVDLWRTHWNAAQRSDYTPDDARMALAMKHMRKAAEHTEIAVACRKAANEFQVGDDDKTVELDEARAASDRAACEAWHAAIAVGMWPDTDLDPAELEWLIEAVGEVMREMHGMAVQKLDVLPPMSLREERKNEYGEMRKVIVGAVGVTEIARLSSRADAFALCDAVTMAKDLGAKIKAPKAGRLRLQHIGIALRRAGLGATMRPDGTLSVFQTDGEILLKTEHKWLVVDEATAAKLAEESKTPAWDEKRREKEKARVSTTKVLFDVKTGKNVFIRENERLCDSLSDSPTDPRERGFAPPRGDERPPG